MKREADEHNGSVLNYEGHTSQDHRSQDHARPRKCLSCTETFASTWQGERICKRCKQGAAWRTGVTYKPL